MRPAREGVDDTHRRRGCPGPARHPHPDPVASQPAEGPRAGADLGHRPGRREHRGDRGVHDAGRPGRRRHDGDRRARGHRRRGHAPGGAVRPAHQAGAEQRRWALRLLTPRVRGLRRLPGRVVLLDPGLGRQCGDRRLLGLLRRRPVRHQPPDGHGELGHRPGGPVGAGGREPGRAAPDGLVPERHRRPQVPAAAVRRDRRVVLRPKGPLRSLQRLGRQPLQRHRDRGRCRPVLVHRGRSGGDDGQAGAGSPQERAAGLDARNGGQRHPLRAGHGGRHGPGVPPHPGQHRVAVRQRLPEHVPPHGLGREVHRRRWPSSRGSGP